MMMLRSSILLLASCFLLGSLTAQDPLVGAIEGRFVWNGEPFPPREVLWPPGLRDQDIVLERMLVGRKVLDESLIVDAESSGIRDCLVLLPDFQLPSRAASEQELTIEFMSPSPRILTLPSNAVLKIKNKDPLPYSFQIVDEEGEKHRIEVEPRSESQMKLPPGARLDLVEERFSFLKVILHRVGDLPAIVSGPDGKFAVRGIKAAEVLLEFQHPVLGAGQRRVAVKEGETTEVVIDQTDFVGPEALLRGSPFSGTENPQFRIEGLLVPLKDFQAVVDFLAARHHRFGLPTSLMQGHSLRQVLVPVAASYVYFQNEVSRLEEKAKQFQARLAKGEAFADVARKMTEYPTKHEFGPLGRRDIDPWLGIRVFSSPKKIVVGPIWSARGLHFFLVESVEGSGPDERRSGYQVFFAWSKSRRSADEAELQRALRERARIQVLNPKLADLVAKPRGQ